MAAPLPSEEERLARLVRAHDRWRGREHLQPPAERERPLPEGRAQYLSSDLAGRYTLPMRTRSSTGRPLDNSYAGTRYTDEIEALANAAGAAACSTDASRRSGPSPGHIAALSALAPLAPAGRQDPRDRPRPGRLRRLRARLHPRALRLHRPSAPRGRARVPPRRVDALEEIRRERPHAVVLGQSFFLFPYPLREIAEAAHSVGALVLYDASHVLGLIAGGEFQDPLREGADVLYGSTHKSFPGPQGGLLVTDREDLFQQIDPALVWRVFDNAHWNRIAGLAQTLLELERFGPEYAKTVIANAQALAAALTPLGLPLVAESDGFTRSHQIAHRPRRTAATRTGSARSRSPGAGRRQRLITDLIGRLGTAEVTRLGPYARGDAPDGRPAGPRRDPEASGSASEVLAWRHRPTGRSGSSRAAVAMRRVRRRGS